MYSNTLKLYSNEFESKTVVGTWFIVNTPLRYSKAIKYLKSDWSIVPGIL